jgi:hypothetical protein
MTRSKIADWTYMLGWVSALAALAFRSLFFFTELSVTICRNYGVKPSSFLQLAVLFFVISIASRGE